MSNDLRVYINKFDLISDLLLSRVYLSQIKMLILCVIWSESSVMY